MKLPFLLVSALALGSPAPAQNTNERAPTATNSLEFAGGGSVSVSYRSFTVAGGRSLKMLMTKGAQGDQYREFYNTQYLPNFLHGKLELGADVMFGELSVAKGSYTLSFRIDNDLVWHMVLMKPDSDEELCAIALETSEDTANESKRLVIQPVAADEDGSGHLQLSFGSLGAKVGFRMAKKPASKPTSPVDGGK